MITCNEFQFYGRGLIKLRTVYELSCEDCIYYGPNMNGNSSCLNGASEAFVCNCEANKNVQVDSKTGNK